MAYPPGQDAGVFSNPTIISQGVPAGALKSASTGADNATVINYAAPILASLRDPDRIAPAPIFTFGIQQPDHLTFTTLTPIGQTEVQVFQISNNEGDAPLQITEFALSGDTTPFSILFDQAEKLHYTS